jgi:hypothetical protein
MERLIFRVFVLTSSRVAVIDMAIWTSLRMFSVVCFCFESNLFYATYALNLSMKPPCFLW